MEKLKKICDFILIAVFLLSVLSVGALTVLPVKSDVKLSGQPQYNMPRMFKKEVINGKYFRRVENYYFKTYPLRNVLTRSFNQIKYTVFHKGGTSRYVLGDEHIFEIRYIRDAFQFDTTDEYLEKIDVYSEYAQDIKYIQDELNERGKGFIYLIAPNKAEVYAEAVPQKYVFNSQSDIYPSAKQALIDAFDKEGVIYYDATQTARCMIEEGEYDFFYTTSNHWNVYSAARSLQDMLKKYNEVYGCDLPMPKIASVEISKVPTELSDTALNKVLNIWSGKLDDEYYIVNIDYDVEEDFSAPLLFRFGTSYQRFMTYAMDCNKVFKEQDYYKYLKTKVNVGETDESVELWLDDNIENIDLSGVIANDIFIMESVANVVPESHFIFAETFAEYLRELDID